MSKKCLFFPCMFFCVFMLSTSPVVAQKGSLSLVPSPMSSPGVGEEFELSVNITGGQSVAGYQVTVAFDATALEYVSSKNGDYLPVGAFWVPAKHQGSRVVLAATALGGESQGNGTLAVVTFKVKAVKASTVSLSEALLSNKLGQTLRPQVTGAEITDPHEGPWVTVGPIHSSRDYVDGELLEFERNDLESGKYRPGSKHKVIFIVVKDRTRERVPSANISLSYKERSTTATFRPAVLTTDKNGQAETEITFGEQPGNLEFFVKLEAPPRVELAVSYTSPSVDGEPLELKWDRWKSYLPDSKHKVIFTVTKERTGEPVPSVVLSLNKQWSTATATFNPAVITTDRNGQAETEITFGEQPGRFSMHVEIDPGSSCVSMSWGYTPTVYGQGVDFKSNLSPGCYRPGSKHKLILTLTNARTGKPMPSVPLNLSANKGYPRRKTTVTFNPAVITTDKNGQAETEITFGEQPGRFSMSVEIDPGSSWVSVSWSYISIVDGQRVDFKSNLSHGYYLPGSKHKWMLTLTNAQTGKPMPSVPLNLSTYRDSPTTATFSPAVITTDKNGQAETEITFGEQPGYLTFLVKQEAPPRVSMSWVYTPIVGGQRVDLKSNLSSGDYLPGSKHKWMLTLTNAQTGKPMPSIRLNLSAYSNKTTLTFRPAVLTTDENGQAETEITFGKQPGLASLSVYIPSSTVVFHYLSDHPPVGAGVDIDITLDGASGELSDFSSDHARSKDVSYSLGPTTTRKKLVVKTKNSKDSAKSVPDVNLVFNVGYQSKRHVTFEPKTVRTDRNGRAVTYITFEAGQGDVQVYIDLSRKVSFGIYGGFKGSTVITLDGADEKLSSDRLDTSYRIPTYEFGRKLVVEVKDARHRLDIVFKEMDDVKGRVTFEPKAIRTDSNGRAETFITFRAGLWDVNIAIVVNLNILDKNQYGANVYNYSDGKKAVLIKGLRLSGVDTSRYRPDFTRYGPLSNNKHFKLYAQGEGTYYCGSTSGRMLLRYYGVKVDLRTFNKISGFAGRPEIAITPDELRRGLGLLPVNVKKFYGTKSHSRHAALREYISQNRPPIVLLRVDPGVGYHYVVVVGYDTKSDKFLIADPGGDEGAFHWMPWTYLKRCWELSPTAWKEYVGNNSPDKKKDGNKDTWKTDNFWTRAGNLGARVLNHINEYTMLVPENAPPYHHLESDTFTYRLGPVRFRDREWAKEITFAGPIVAWRFGVVNSERNKGRSEGNKFIASGKVISPLSQVVTHVLTAGIGTLISAVFFPDIPPTLVVTAWYKPSSPAAPTLPLPLPPGTTALLPNYPNPFNPETWIPYHLAKPADVTLTIYAIDGKVVRHLDLGHQVAGFYQSKSRAAYWDGRNEVGERVASGIYFYTLTAGEFAATQKMLIVK